MDLLNVIHIPFIYQLHCGDMFFFLFLNPGVEMVEDLDSWLLIKRFEGWRRKDTDFIGLQKVPSLLLKRFIPLFSPFFVDDPGHPELLSTKLVDLGGVPLVQFFLEIKLDIFHFRSRDEGRHISSLTNR